MDTQKIESGQNGQTDVQDDNRVIVKIRDLKENEFFLNHIETSPTRLMKWAIKEYKAGLKEVQ